MDIREMFIILIVFIILGFILYWISGRTWIKPMMKTACYWFVGISVVLFLLNYFGILYPVLHFHKSK